MKDLEEARASLTPLIKEFEEKLENEFGVGLESINASFKNFFVKIFGGGEAKLFLSKDSEDEGDSSVVGVEVDVSLPRKRLKGLHSLSGGERALTSIALLFAMAVVNPPPFIVLDETDAALDEANSRKYGDALKELAKKSQLILITHNRETMARADILYGITMGHDGISKLLSVKFSDAVKIAKT
jgi:chromosome segregation protein